MRSLFARIERLQRAVRAKAAGHRQPIRVGVAESLSQPRLSACLNRWLTHSPGTPIERHEFPTVEFAKAPRLEELHAGFRFGLPRVDGIVQQPVWRIPCEH